MIEHFANPIQKHAGDKIIELLVKGGANINQRDKDAGMTPYDEADAFGMNRNISEVLSFNHLIKFTILDDERMKEFLVTLGATPTALSILKQILDIKLNDTSI